MDSSASSHTSQVDSLRGAHIVDSWAVGSTGPGATYDPRSEVVSTGLTVELARYNIGFCHRQSRVQQCNSATIQLYKNSTSNEYTTVVKSLLGLFDRIFRFARRCIPPFSTRG
jgi:hypothetical protein